MRRNSNMESKVIDGDDEVSSENLKAAGEAELFDKDGKKTTLKEVITGKRVLLVAVRHWWCLNCQTYVRHLSDSIPPSNLPEDTSVIVIGCGSYQPIPHYYEVTHCPYPIYANPSLSLYNAFQFKSSMGSSKKGEEKEYEKDLGGSVNRIWRGLVEGPVKNISMAPHVGPKSLNGGEVILEQDGSCSYMHRMKHTADHTDLQQLAEKLGSKFTPRRGSVAQAKCEDEDCN